MGFNPGMPQIDALVKALSAAASRGVEVRLVVDAYIYLLNEAQNRVGPWFWKTPREGDGLPSTNPLVGEALGQLERAGGHYAIINRPKRRLMNPLGGRSHIKFAVIGQRAYIGSANLNGRNLMNFVVGWEEPRAAEWLWGLAGRMQSTGSANLAVEGEDVEYGLDQQILLLDAGVPGRSVILRRALDLIDEASERVMLTCQYFPNEVTTEHLLAAHKRGVKVEIHYNAPQKHSFPNNILHQGVEWAARRRLPESFFVHVRDEGKDFLHSKFVSSERAVLMGSHNLVKAGVTLGTAEIALLSFDEEFVREAEAAMRRLLGLVY
jgi:phosphatidylserine/phosphatidylglycerophosphate/cardiolipin synthase-like enzyme